jgi:hypothetical protein
VGAFRPWTVEAAVEAAMEAGGHEERSGEALLGRAESGRQWRDHSTGLRARPESEGHH